MIAAQALTAARVQRYANDRGLAVEERCSPLRRELVVDIPLDELNGILDELLYAGLLRPLQVIQGKAASHIVLAERFATLTWVDVEE